MPLAENATVVVVTSIGKLNLQRRELAHAAQTNLKLRLKLWLLMIPTFTRSSTVPTPIKNSLTIALPAKIRILNRSIWKKVIVVSKIAKLNAI